MARNPSRRPMACYVVKRFGSIVLNSCCRAVNLLKQAIVVGVDAEFTQVRLHTQKEVISTVPRLALLQLAIDRDCFVVDTLRLRDLSPLMEIIGNPAIAILLHGAGGDMRVMAETGAACSALR